MIFPPFTGYKLSWMQQNLSIADFANLLCNAYLSIYLSQSLHVSLSIYIIDLLNNDADNVIYSLTTLLQ